MAAVATVAAACQLPPTDTAVFVSASGTDTDTCGVVPTDPCASIDHAEARGIATGRQVVRVAGGSYGPFTVLNGFSLYGGYNPGFTSMGAAGDTTTVNGAYSAATSSAWAIRATSTTAFTKVYGMTVTGPVTTAAQPTAGVRVDGTGSNLTLDTLTIRGGTGATATGVVVGGVNTVSILNSTIDSGTPLASGSSAYGVRALAGANVTVSGSRVTAQAGVAGGNSGQPAFGASNGFAGGDGGNAVGPSSPGSGGTPRGFHYALPKGGTGGTGGNFTGPGEAGYGGESVGEVPGGAGGEGGCGSTFGCGSGAGGGFGGKPGAAGVPGAGGTNTAANANSFWVGANGAPGGAGTSGSGGGGGGGGKTASASGGGAGAGGGGGEAGWGGQAGGFAGGGSFGVYAYNATITLSTSTSVTAGLGAPGGTGSAGGAGGRGGNGGNGGGPSCCSAGRGGGGGGGAAGGHGAGAGGGAGGPSIAAFHTGTGTLNTAGAGLTREASAAPGGAGGPGVPGYTCHDQDIFGIIVSVAPDGSVCQDGRGWRGDGGDGTGGGGGGGDNRVAGPSGNNGEPGLTLKVWDNGTTTA